MSKKFILAVLLALGILAAWIADGQSRLGLSSYEVAFARLPAAFDGFRIVHLSDLHGKRFGEENEKLAAMVAQAEPDVIAITGDLIDGPEDMDYARELAGALTDIAPVYYVTGNHEWAGRVARPLKQELRELGVTVLDNKHLFLQRDDGQICLAGVDDPLGPYDMKTLTEVAADIRDSVSDAFIVLLAHRYERFSAYAEHRMDLALTGHAHGGIVRLPFTDGLYGPFGDWFPKYTSGVNRKGDTVMVTSRGLGGVGRSPVPRVGNNPEVIVITLKGA